MQPMADPADPENKQEQTVSTEQNLRVFAETWKSHINDLGIMGMSLQEDEYEELKEIRKRLDELVDLAVENIRSKVKQEEGS